MAKPKKTARSKLAKSVESEEASQSRQTESAPICIAMVICEQAIVAQDFTLSAIRIIDTVNLPVDSIPEGVEGFELPGLRLFAIIKKGDSTGKNISLQVVCIDPKGRRQVVGFAPAMTIEGGPEMGGNAITPVHLINGGQGVYWLELFANGSLIARTPIKLVFGLTLPGGSISKPQLE